MTTRILNTSLVLAAACAVAAAPLDAQGLASGFEPSQREAITQVGTRGANFLRIGPSARARALGDAGTSLIGDATSVFYNPATGALAENFQFAATYSDLYGGSGLKHAYLGAVLPFGQGAVTANAVIFTSGDIPATTEWSPDGFDPIRGQYTKWDAVSAGLGYSRQITDRLSLGFTGKYIQEGIDFANVNWVALDVGTVFETGVYGVRLAMAVRNIGGTGNFEGAAIYTDINSEHRIFTDKILGSEIQLRYDTQPMELPTTFRFAIQAPLIGTATSLLGQINPRHNVNLLTEITDGFDTAIQSRWGVEYSFDQMVFLRVGKQFMNEDRAPWEFSDGLAAGAGVSLPFLGRNLGIDYAYTSMGVLENVQTFSFTFGS